MPDHRRLSWEEERDAGERSARINEIHRELDYDSGARGHSLTRKEREDAIERELLRKQREDDEDKRREEG
jgi:hypothetical protein